MSFQYNVPSLESHGSYEIRSFEKLDDAAIAQIKRDVEQLKLWLRDAEVSDRNTNILLIRANSGMRYEYPRKSVTQIEFFIEGTAQKDRHPLEASVGRHPLEAGAPFEEEEPRRLIIDVNTPFEAELLPRLKEFINSLNPSPPSRTGMWSDSPHRDEHQRAGTQQPESKTKPKSPKSGHS